jgi:ribosome silencing factor RsfS/YbeB/iojap
MKSKKTVAKLKPQSVDLTKSPARKKASLLKGSVRAVAPVVKAKAAAKAKTKAAATKAKPKSKPKAAGRLSQLLVVVAEALGDMKAQQVTVLDVHELTDVTDVIVIASGTSDRHVKSIASNVVMAAKRGGFRPAGVEGESEGEWVLVDLGDVIVHVMLPRVREFYGLEKLWDVQATDRTASD